MQDSFTPRHHTNYADPRVKDPITSFRLSHWVDPTMKQMNDISCALSHYANIKRITYVWKITIVEIDFDGRVSGRRSLPGGCTTLCNHSPNAH